VTVVGAFVDGFRRVRSAPAVLAGVYGVTLLLAVPPALLLREELRAHLGSSLAAETAAAGVNYDWWQELSSDASGLRATFVPGIIGFAAVLENTSAIADGRWPDGPVAGLAAAYVLIWTFLAGGVLDRFARQRPTKASGFFAAAGVYFFRFLRLAFLAALGYWLLFGVVHPWLFDRLYGWAIRELDVERTAFGIRLLLYGVFAALLTGWNLTLDYAKIRAVVEDRRSMIAALEAGARFAWRRPGRVAALYGLNAAAFLLLLALYGLVAPGAGPAGIVAWLGFLVSQVYLVARLGLKLLFYASETAFFQGELAHAGYTAAPLPTWPDSPAAEAIVGPVR
jgi:hypothetical protein